MNRIKISLAIIALAVAVIFIAPMIVNPILKKKILTTLHQKYPDYVITIERLNWQLVPSRLTFEKIIILTKAASENGRYLKGEIASIRFKGIKNIKALFRNEYEIREIIVNGCNIEGKVPFHKKEKIPLTSTVNILIDHILLDQINLSVSDTSSAQTLIVEQGMLRFNALEIRKKDTIGIFHQFDFTARTITSNSPDSMYTYRVNGTAYSDSLKLLSIDSFSIDPNYKRYEFTARVPYETDRFKVKISDFKVNQFSGDDFYNSGHLVGSWLSIGNMDMEAFRDKRKQDSKENKPVFQTYIYRYPGRLKIDSMIINNGTITYIEHADKAIEPGRVHLDAFKTKIYNITNDTIYKTKDTSLTVISEAMLMGKSRMNITLKAKLFDPTNTFSMVGSLAAMDVKELHPILEKNAFIHSRTARINKLNFHFVANDTKATGEMVLLYDGLNLAVENKRTKDTTGLKEQIISLIANKSTWDSNPIPKEEARVGMIEYERDPTRFVFNYCVKSILSGVQSTIIKHPKKKKSFLQRIFTRKEDKQKDKN